MAGSKKIRVSYKINGYEHDVLINPRKTLLEVLREDLNLCGTKHGCELGECGACTTLVNGELILSCLAIASDYDSAEITTIEGVERSLLQNEFANHGAAQCGYCTPGIILAVKKLLEENPSPTRDQIKKSISGNLCRCTGYLKIFEAVESAAKPIAETKN